MARLENVRTLLTSYYPPISELFFHRGVKAQLGQFLSLRWMGWFVLE